METEKKDEMYRVVSLDLKFYFDMERIKNSEPMPVKVTGSCGISKAYLDYFFEGDGKFHDCVVEDVGDFVKKMSEDIFSMTMDAVLEQTFNEKVKGGKVS